MAVAAILLACLGLVTAAPYILGPKAFGGEPLTVAKLESDGWELVFRATAGNGEIPFNSWTNGAGTTDIKPVDMVPSNSPNFRVKNLHTEWAGLSPKYVKLGLYKDNNEVGFVVFNGVGSDIKNWFAANNLLASRWPNMTPTSTYNIFSIDGDVRSTLQRRFMISSAYGGCPNDIGYLAVIEIAGACKWDKHASYPQFVYAKDNTYTTWEEENFDRADYMAIFISS